MRKQTLAEWLAAKRLKQREAAELFGVHPSIVCRLLAGKSCTVATAAKIREKTKGAVDLTRPGIAA